MKVVWLVYEDLKNHREIMKNIRFTQLTSECDLLNHSIFYLNQDNSI
jgi:hypothetical protein